MSGNRIKCFSWISIYFKEIWEYVKNLQGRVWIFNMASQLRIHHFSKWTIQQLIAVNIDLCRQTKWYYVICNFVGIILMGKNIHQISSVCNLASAFKYILVIFFEVVFTHVDMIVNSKIAKRYKRHL